MLQNNPRLKSLIVSLWNTLYGGGISNPITAIEQITFLLFIKKMDELESKREIEAKKTKRKYKSKFDGNYIPWIDENYYKSSPVNSIDENFNFENKRKKH